MDFDARNFTIRQACSKSVVVTVIGPPESSRGRHTPPLAADLMKALKAPNACQEAEALELSTAYGSTDLIAVYEAGQALSPETHGHMFHTLARQAKMPTIRLHDNRHTAATLMIERDEPTVTVAKVVRAASSDHAAGLRLPPGGHDARGRYSVLQPGPKSPSGKSWV